MNSLLLINMVYPILATIGMFLIANRNSKGFLVFLLVEVCMAYVGFETRQIGILLMAVVYFFTNIYSWYKWKNN